MIVIDLDVCNDLEKSYTKRCMQNGWGARYYFPCCPAGVLESSPLESYFQNFKAGIVFAYNDDSPKLLLLESLIVRKNHSSILVMCEREGRMCEREGYHPWLIFKITFAKGIFIHSKLGTYFEKDEADAEFYKFSQVPTEQIL